MLGHWRIASRQEDKDPEAEHGKEIDHEYDTPEPDVAGEDLDCTVQDPADDEAPRQNHDGSAWLELEKYQAGDMEEQRPLELVGQVGTDTRLDSGPRIAAVSSATDAPHGRSPRDREQDIEKTGERDVRNHWSNQGLRHT